MSGPARAPRVVLDPGVRRAGEVWMTATQDARRLASMLRHSMHLALGVLWLVGAWRVVQAAAWLQLVAALAMVGAYLAGLGWQGRHHQDPRQRLVGRTWVALLVGLWAVLCLLAAPWGWLGFPLLFLVLFILPEPASWLVLVAMAGWMVASPLLRGEAPSVGGVLGPALASLVAVVAWLVARQLRADVAEQRRLLAEVAAAQAELLAGERERARVEERERLAADLHDTLAQGLNSIVLLARAAAARHPGASPELEVLESTARDNLAQARSMVRERQPVQLPNAQASVVARLQAVVDEVRLREQALGRGLDVALVVDDDAGQRSTAAPSEEVAEALVMATRASLANVVQHARASRCRVVLGGGPDHLALDVVDDGIGFDPLAVAEGSYGLRGLRRRVGTLGGRIEVDSEAGHTAVAVVLPLGGGGER